FQPVNPRPFLQARSFLIQRLRVGTELIIRLKWGQTEYKGKLESIDSYMNVLLRDTEEFIDGKNTGTLGLVLIRVEMTDLGLR
ncbi:small nuclear ribonucleoprotein SmF, putative, partial [Aspergillus fumigatus A1163]